MENTIVLNSKYFIINKNNMFFSLYKINKNYFDNTTKTPYCIKDGVHILIETFGNVFSLLKHNNLSKYNKLFY